MFTLKYVTLIYLVIPTRCFLLLNTHNPNGIRMSEYCPKMAHCEEGTHVLCMYYDPVRIMGPACSQDAQNVTATEKFKVEVLDIVNEMRRRVAKGEEVGLANQPLPKAYGMQKLEWDNELAAFAQIWANQCTMRHDLCRATKRFSNPGQITSIFRFSFPDWQVLSKGENQTSEKFLTDDKVILAMRKSLRNAYKLKKFLTKEMITSFPDFKKQPELESSKIYLTIVDGKSTHVGCGVSAFSDYYGQVRDEDVIHNVVEIVCNFATQPTVGNKVYETEKPIGSNSTCGCPPGFLEDKDCFCISKNKLQGMAKGKAYKSRAALRKDNNWCDTTKGGDKHCRPTVVLVPIFKMEDAPRDKLYKDQTTLAPNLTMISRSKSKVHNGFYGLHQDLYTSTLGRSDLIVNKVYHKYTRNSPNDVKKRYFNKKVVSIYPVPNARGSNPYLPQTRRLRGIQIAPKTKRESIFTRVSKFKLPIHNKHEDRTINNYWINSTRNIYIKQVKPRKDFSKAKELVAAYLKQKKQRNGFSTPYPHHEMNSLVQINKKDFSIPYHNHQTNSLVHDNQLNSLVHDNQLNSLVHDNQVNSLVHENQLNSLVHDNQLNTLVHDNQLNTLLNSNYNSQLNHSAIPNARALFPEANHDNLLAFTTTKKGDNKLLHLLESLEREIQNTELNRDLKEMVNAKIRQLYGSVVSDNAGQLKSDRSNILDSLISRLENKTGRKIMDYRDGNPRRNREDDYTFEPTSTPKYDILLKRNQNAISLYGRPNYTPLKSRFSPLADINHIYDSFVAISKNMYAKDNNYKRPSTAYAGKNSFDLPNDHKISTLDKIKYFREKEEDLEKKIQSLRNTKHRYELQRESSRKMRPVFIPRSEPEKPRPTTNLQNYSALLNKKDVRAIYSQSKVYPPS